MSVVIVVGILPIIVVMIVGMVLEFRGVIREGTSTAMAIAALVPEYFWYPYFIDTPRSNRLSKFLAL